MITTRVDPIEALRGAGRSTAPNRLVFEEDAGGPRNRIFTGFVNVVRD